MKNIKFSFLRQLLKVLPELQNEDMMYMNLVWLHWLERLIEARIKLEQKEIMTEVNVRVITMATGEAI